MGRPQKSYAVLANRMADDEPTGGGGGVDGGGGAVAEMASLRTEQVSQCSPARPSAGLTQCVAAAVAVVAGSRRRRRAAGRDGWPRCATAMAKATCRTWPNPQAPVYTPVGIRIVTATPSAPSLLKLSFRPHLMHATQCRVVMPENKWSVAALTHNLINLMVGSLFSPAELRSKDRAALPAGEPIEIPTAAVS